jgi:hypothetical protein
MINMLHEKSILGSGHTRQVAWLSFTSTSISRLIATSFMSASFSSSSESYAKKKRKKHACTYRYNEEMVMVLKIKILFYLAGSSEML